jgi:hypothetical protein
MPRVGSVVEVDGEDTATAAQVKKAKAAMERNAAARRKAEEELVATANAEYEQVKACGREGMKHVRKCGEALIKYREPLAKRAWKKCFATAKGGKARFTFTYQTARSYIRVAEHWEQVKDAASVREAIWILNGRPRPGKHREPLERVKAVAAEMPLRDLEKLLKWVQEQITERTTANKHAERAARR